MFNRSNLNTRVRPDANRWYNIYRWAVTVLRTVPTCLLLLLPTAELRSETITVPTIAQYNSWDATTRRAFDWSLGGINTAAMIAAGELTPGAVIDPNLPPINMTIQMYRWSEMWASAQRQSAVDYQELLQWRRFTDSVESCDKWLERQRKFGIAPVYPNYPAVIDAGMPFYDTYTIEPMLDPLTPTFTVVRPWLWGVQ